MKDGYCLVLKYPINGGRALLGSQSNKFTEAMIEAQRAIETRDYDCVQIVYIQSRIAPRLLSEYKLGDVQL
jgi:hypothetical protein